MKIDSQTVVPVGWLISGFAATISVTVLGAFWISTVNFRLQRIEEKLGIPAHADNKTNFIANASAGQK